MKIRRYIIGSIIFLAIIGSYAYVINDSVYSVELFGINVDLPVFVWVLLPAILLLIFSSAHFTFYSIVNFYKIRKINKDLDKYSDVIKSDFMDKKISIKVKDERLDEIYKFILNRDKFKSSNEMLNKIIENAKKINDGEYVDITKDKLPKDSKIYKKNLLNEINNDIKKCEKIALNCTNNDELCTKAYEKFATFGDYKKLKKVQVKKNKNIVFNILTRINAKENSISLEDSEIIKLSKDVDFTQDDYLILAKEIKNNFQPDKLIELFYKLQENNESASLSYIYINLEFEKIQEVKNYLDNFDENDFMKIRYYLKLKEINQKVKLDDFL